METKDPALTKTPISSHQALSDMIVDTTSKAHGHHTRDEKKGTQALQETVVGSSLVSDIENLDDTTVSASVDNRTADGRVSNEGLDYEEPSHKAIVDAELAQKEARVRDDEFADSHSELESDTSVTNNTETFEENIVHSEHVNDGDQPARQPDRRDQEGNPFDDNVNEYTMSEDAPKSDSINDLNRYANIDNAQSRVLNPDEKD